MGKSFDFMSAVYPEPNTGCWLWSGAQHPSGHGLVNPKTHNGLKYAHRYSYLIHKGQFDYKLHILHKCDVPDCVNPDHLYSGTHQDNHRDMLERSNPKYAVGNQIHTAKLNPELVREIRKEFTTGTYSKRALGRKYGVTHTAICDLISGYRWSHVE